MLKDKPMTPITPTIECYQCVFKIKDISIKEPAVFPAGINFQTADGTISGTPTEEKEKTEYTIIARAEDVGFDAEFKLTMMVTTEKANYTLIILIVICVVVLVGIFGTCLFCRIRGTGRNTRKARQLKTAGGAKPLIVSKCHLHNRMFVLNSQDLFRMRWKFIIFILVFWFCFYNCNEFYRIDSLSRSFCIS